MLFNKQNTGAEELREATGSYWKSNDFSKVKVKVELATEEVVTLTGKAIYLLALNHYNSEHYQADPEPESEPADSGSGGGGIPAVDYALLDKLVQHFQLPIAFLATLWHYQANDVSHEDTGRKVKIDAESEKLAWEWMYQRDDAMALEQYQRTLDRLFRFLNEHVADFDEWEKSDVMKTQQSLFIRTTAHFNRLFPIDESPAFFARVAPFMREVERRVIKPILGATKFAALKAGDLAGSLDEDDLELLDYVCDPIPLLTMAMAVKRLSLQVLPGGVVQQYFSPYQSKNASLPANLEMVNAVSKTMQNDGTDLVNELKKFWSAQQTDETDETITGFLPGMEDTDNFISL